MKNVDQEKLKDEFAASADMQAEFGGDVTAYLAFKRAAAEGRVRGLKSSVLPASPAGAGPAAIDEAKLKQEFSGSEDLKNEYGSIENYVAFRKNDAAGRVRMCSGRGVFSFSASAPKTEKLGKGLPISEKVRDTFREAASRVKIIQDDELAQYEKGIPVTP